MRRFLASVALALCAVSAKASVGLATIAGAEGDAPITVCYPSPDPARPVVRGPFTLDMALNGAPARGNGRLVVVSHGSGGSPLVHTDLARALVERGFVVAMPEHVGDNFRDTSKVGPESWKRRPAEVSRSIDALGRDPRFAPLLALDKVGVFGMSAGGHAALVLAGGRWSPARLKQHCEAHIAEDFHGCVGLATQLTGGAFDGMKKTIVLWIIRLKLDDPGWYAYADPRVAAIVADVPLASDFDLESLSEPRVPLALVTSREDRWLTPRFHGDAVLQACKKCTRLFDFANGGHGAMLSPFPPALSGLAAELLADPPDFDRSAVPQAERKIADFFSARLSISPPTVRRVSEIGIKRP